MKRLVLALALLTLGRAALAQVPVYPEDAAHVSGQQGPVCLAVRQDTATALAGTSGDYAPLEVDSVGRLWTSAVQSGTWSVTASGTVTCNAGSGTFAVDPSDEDARVLGRTKIHDGTDVALISGTGSLQVTCDNCGAPPTFEDEDAFTVSTTAISNIGFLVDETTPDSAPENSAAAARMSANRNQYVQIRDAAGNERGANVTAGNALVVDGSASTQPVSGTVTANVGTFPDNEPVNVAQMNGVAVTMGNGASGTGVQRVTLADDSTGEVRIADNAGNQIESATAAPSSSARGLVVRPVGPCRNETVTYFSVDIVTATTVLVATGVGGQHVYICGLNLVTAGANNVAIVAGTGATCGTSTAGMNGGVTAGEGWNFAANGGIALPNAGGSHMRTESTGDSVCIITSAAVQLSGTIVYVIE